MSEENRPGGISFLTSAVLFTVSSIGLTVFFRSSAAYEYGRETLAIVLCVCGLWLLFFNAKAVRSHRRSASRNVSNARLSTLPAPVGSPSSNGALSFIAEKVGPEERHTLSQRWILSLAITIALATRLELFHELSTRTQCMSWTTEGLVPFFVAIFELRKQNKSGQRALTLLLPPFVLVLASFLARLNDGYSSTYICPLVTHGAYHTTLMQAGAVILDVGILRGMDTLATASVKYVDLKKTNVAGLWAPVFIGAAVVEMVGRVCFVLSSGSNRSNASPGWLTFSIFVRAFFFTLMCTSASQIVLALGMSGVSFLYVFILTDAAILSQLCDGLGMYPNIPFMRAILALVLLYMAAYLHYTAETQKLLDGQSTKRRNVVYRILIWGSVGFTLFLLARQKGNSPYHPINLLIERSEARHQLWTSMAKRSTTLKEAALEYHDRYNRPPPPGFDAWYEYATNRSSIIIDQFDQIYHDLLPFTAISPAELRLLTSDLISTPWNDVVAIHVRDGNAELQEGIKPTHRWMVKGVKEMVDKFVEFLPDMDIPLNINDEPRVAVPWEVIEPLKQVGQLWKPDVYHLSDEWSADRSLPDVWQEKRMFQELGRVGISDKLARPTCPPGSPVRSTYVKDKRHVCLKCAAPHSLGQFLSKWTASGDICHQPDVLHLHGFFLSPNDLKVTRQLLPVFSQSRVSGFNDILYPSAWNYVDKAEYKKSEDVPWGEKYDALFWRGTTTEGYAQGGNWAGMIRQRFVHLINNHTSTASVLLPTRQGSNKYKYVPINGQEVQSRLGLNTSVEFVEQINRAEQSQGAIQTREFGVGEKLDFKVHWTNKYLFDSDGAGFSGRFLPFLQSRSVPFRSGLFRQWLDERVTAWVHYVPIDIRLHGLWSTLAYFAGARSPEGKVLMRSHDHGAEHIANAGRIWANATLRKEDMEIYMFRLLLEWGRLTDDNRDRLGFALPKE